MGCPRLGRRKAAHGGSSRNSAGGASARFHLLPGRLRPVLLLGAVALLLVLRRGKKWETKHVGDA